MQGTLFSQDFLSTAIKDTPVWTELSDSALDAFIDALRKVYSPFNTGSEINEAVTEDEIIVKTLGLLGWNDLALSQVTASGSRREDVPDLLLFADAAAKLKALAEKKDDRRYRHGIAVVESKRWMRPLDRGEGTNRMDASVPSNQILRYLSAVEVASDRKIRWGILTNGRTWRLYFQGARSRSEDFFELDVAALVGVRGIEAGLFDGDIRHGLKLLYCLFHREAFLPQSWDPDARTFHEYALNEARQYEEKVSQTLGDRVFKLVFPALSNALMQGDPSAPRPLTRDYLDEVRAGALILLYRLLFLLYAEDRNLLPIRDLRYRDYSLRKLREDIRDKRDSNGVFSETAARIWETLRSLFNAISNGDSALGLPAYNGGLFDQDAVPLLARVHIPDSQLAPLLDELSRRSDDLLRAWINYRDLSVQHLGSIYERLLEFKLDVVDEDGRERLVALPTSFARKVSGSYYTHDDLVQLLIRETLAPLLDERRDAFNARLDKSWKKKLELKPSDWDELDRLDPASRMLDLKVCDPAMGSGHFLVSLVDVLADQILEAIDAAEDKVSTQRWAEHLGSADQPAWRSPLVARIADIRERILATAADQGWAVTRAQLDDRHIVRRMILKRVIHGVDKNPMAVELAKVALWLHTFTVGAPLSFLDHHLRCGDALHGENLSDVFSGLQQWGVLFQAEQFARLEIAARSISEIADLTDIDVAEAHRSKELMDDAQAGLAPLDALLDLWRALRWLIPGWPDKRKAARSAWAQGAQALLSGRYNLTGVALAGRIEGRIDKRERADVDAANALLAAAGALARREHFMHWPVAFPGVWQDGRGGFDAVIGNPPWDRIKLQEVEWFAERRLEVAQAARADDRKKLIKALQKNGDPLWNDYVEAQDASISAARVFRDCGDFPLLSTGDINLYGLFVERAQSLIKPRGVVGLLCPSGIAADLGAAEFFRSISTTQRLAALFDFENRKVFFPDVHASFKFCVLVFGGVSRTFKATRCAFYLHRTDELANADRLLALTSADFASINPNTGAAPVFRTRRDGEITTRIYARQPVLVDRRDATIKKVWPVKYATMFHMTNDSHLFKRRDELEREGWYPVGGNRWKKGEAEALPLLVGRMIYNYDHRASDVTVNSANLHNAALSASLTNHEKADPNRFAVPQYWVAASDIPDAKRLPWCVAFRDIARTTDMRTMIAAVVPSTAAGNKLPLFMPDGISGLTYARAASLLLANLNSLVFDFVARQKVQSTAVNLYIVEQLPMIRPEQFDARIGSTTISDFIRAEVLRLSYTAHDLSPFARDLGFDGPPFTWDVDDRRHRIARLDALFFHLYGLGRDDAAYVMDTFPIVRDQDVSAHGRYLTKDLVLAYMNAIEAGDLTAIVKV